MVVLSIVEFLDFSFQNLVGKNTYDGDTEAPRKTRLTADERGYTRIKGLIKTSQSKDLFFLHCKSIGVDRNKNSFP